MRSETPPAHQLLSGSGPPGAGSGLEPLNGVNDPWRWSAAPDLEGWVSAPATVSWSAGAVIPSFAAPDAGSWIILSGVGTNPFDISNNSTYPVTAHTSFGYDTSVPPVRFGVASDPVTLTSGGSTTAFIFWDLKGEPVQSGGTAPWLGDNTDVLPTEPRTTLTDILGSDFTVTPETWSEEAVGTPGDFYVDTASDNFDLYGPREFNTWGPVAGHLRGSKVDTFNFTSPAAEQTWTQPTGASSVQVVLIGGGAGGDAGDRGATGTLRKGGVSGGGAGWAIQTYPAAALPAAVPVVVGFGGDGGAAVTTNSTVGEDGGSSGGETTFGSLLQAVGGLGGFSNLGGANPSQITGKDQAASGGDGDYSAGCPAGGGGAWVGADNTAHPSGSGGVSTLVPNVTPASSGEAGVDSPTGLPGPGGGGGGGWGGAFGQALPLTKTVVIFANTSTVSTVTVTRPDATTFTLTATDDGTNWVAAVPLTQAGTYTYDATASPGGGAVGGTFTVPSDLGDGGAGGLYGAGGGGGAATTNGGLRSGRGGDGAPGICIVTTFF